MFKPDDGSPCDPQFLGDVLLGQSCLLAGIGDRPAKGRGIDGASSILLSLSLPVTRKKITGTSVFNYFDGLLPEGQLRSHLASANGLSTPDTPGLLRVLGADCAGAVQALPDGMPPDGPADAIPMTDAEVTNVVEALPTWDLPEDFAITASLGGIQSKVLLSRHGEGWAWPGRGAVSTHII